MKIEINDDKRYVDIWLTNAEQQNPDVQEYLKAVYAEYKNSKYLVSVFQSGKQDLYANTLDLLRYNKRRSAEKAVKRAKTR